MLALDDEHGYDLLKSGIWGIDAKQSILANIDRCRSICEVDLLTKPSAWAEQNVYVPPGSAKSGLIDFENAPYQRDILDLIVDPVVRRITLMWGAQTGKTMLEICAQLFFIKHTPMFQMMMQPSEGDLQTWLQTKFNPMIDANQAIADVMAKPRSHEGVNNQKMKSYDGGFMMFSWSGSPKTMAGRSAPKIVCDETDRYDRTSEGHPVSLLWQRAATYGDDRLLMESSTPTIKGASYIEMAYEQGDQSIFEVPCPSCKIPQRLVWRQVKWDKRGDRHDPKSARYECEHCSSQWNDDERHDAIRLGKWKSRQPVEHHRSFHLSELYSCFVKLEQIVQSFLDKKALNDIQAFVNVSLGETWEETAEKVDHQRLIERVEKYPAQVPAGGVVLTAGIDGQADRLEVEIVAWGLGEESWSVDYRVLWGDPLRDDVWSELTELLDETFQHESGAQLPIHAAALDTGGTGGYTQAAYDYCRGKLTSMLFAIKGVSGWGKPIAGAPSKKKARRRRPVKLFPVGVDESKLIVMRRLALDEGPGACHFPDSYSVEYFEQITAEKLQTRFIKGFPVREWHKQRERNEAFDCRNYAFAALKISSPNIARLHKKINASIEEDAPKCAVEKPSETNKNKFKSKRRRVQRAYR